MKISMVGIDHSKAGLSCRERFSFTKNAAVESLERLREKWPDCGCVLLSTCNRTELWISGQEAEQEASAELLCQLKDSTPEEFGPVFVTRRGGEAVMHLLELASGMKSQIFGEDQIVTQVGDAIALAREGGFADSVLQRLFQMAVTAAKRVKTEVCLTSADQSSAAGVASLLKQEFGSLSGLPCLVIGNGVMGRLTAETLRKEGCQVHVTLRQYKYGTAVIPDGCQAVPYEERISLLSRMKAIVSATASPHYTLKREELEPILTDGERRVFADLAVPRDIEPAIDQLAGAVVYDIDQIGGSSRNDISQEELDHAESILREAMDEFANWYYFRDFLPKVQQISRTASDDILWRANRSIHSLDLSSEEEERLQSGVRQAASKVLSKLMFGLRDNLDRELWQDCLESLEKSAMK